MGLAELAAKVNWIDILIILLLLKISYDGFSKGFSSQVVPLLGIFAVLLISLHNYVLIGYVINKLTPFSIAICNLLSFTIISLIIIFLFRVGEIFLTRIIRVEVVSFIERIGGVFLGALKAMLFISFILVIFVLTPIRYLDSSIKDRSLLGTKFLRVGPALYDKVISISPLRDRHERAFMTQRFMCEHWRE